MITQIIQSYLIIFLSIGLGSVLAFLLGVYFIFKRSAKAKQQANLAMKVFTDISGDDVFSTQLDLARAYIETGSQKLASDILKQVVAKGSVAQRSEARTLLESI